MTAGSIALPDFVSAVRQARPMLGAVLEEATDVRVDGETLTVRFPAGQQLFKRQLEQPASLTLLREQAQKLVGITVEVQVELELEDGTREPSPAAAPPVGPPSAPEPPRPEAPPRKSRRADSSAPSSTLIEEARQEPGVDRLLSTFGAQVLDIRPLEIQEPGPDGDAVGPAEEKS